jgi:hypothetical protein
MSKQTSEEITMEQLSERIFRTSMAKTILANQNALAYNEVLSKTGYYKREIKQHCKPLIAALIKLESTEFERVERAESELVKFKGKGVIDQAFEKSNKIIHLLATMVFVDYDDVELVLNALAKDRNSIIGIAKKIKT